MVIPITLGVLEGMQLYTPNDEPDDDEVDEDYIPVEDDDEYDDNDKDGGVGGKNVDGQQAPADVDAYNNDNASIILNPAVTYHDGPIAGVATDKYHTVVDNKNNGTDAAREET